MSENYIPRTKDEMYRLLEAAKGGDEAAREQIIRENAGLVKKVASRFNGIYSEIEDLVQIGYVGLIKAMEKFDYSYDVMFSTYAVPMIMGEIKRFLRDDGRIKVSRSLKSEIYALRKAKSDFVCSNGREPKISQLGEIMGVSPEHILEVLEAEKSFGNIASLDTLVSWEEQKSGMYENSPESGLELMMLREEIAALPEKEKQVIFLRYYKDMTQTQIAEIVGVSQVQVSRLEKKALKTIREKLA